MKDLTTLAPVERYRLLKRKLELHKIVHSYDEARDAVTFGGAQNLSQAWLVSVIIPALLTLVVGGAILFFVLSGGAKGLGSSRALSKGLGFVLALPIVWFIVGLINVVRRIKRNQRARTFSQGRIAIASKKTLHPEVIRASQIDRFEATIKPEKAVTWGKLYVITREQEKVLLLSIHADEQASVQYDLQFIRSYLELLVLKD